MSDRAKSEEMKERWRDPAYREQGLLTLHEASQKHAANRRSCAEGGYRRRKSTQVVLLSQQRPRSSPNAEDIALRSSTTRE